MAKASKSAKSKANKTYRVDPDVYDKAVEKAHRESIALKKRVTVSGLIEKWLNDWVSEAKTGSSGKGR